MIVLRTCTTCGATKTLAEFRPGRHQCLECYKKRQRDAKKTRIPGGRAICVECGSTKTGNRARCEACIEIDATTETHWCTYCTRRMHFSKFYLMPNVAQYSHTCRECAAELMRLRKYHITPAQFKDMLENQNHRCAICKTDDPGGPWEAHFWCVDHDHGCCPGKYSCGKCVRGLLCYPCNSFLLAGAKDDIEILQSAIEYLISHKAHLLQSIA